jgi:hypothetical protein
MRMIRALIFEPRPRPPANLKLFLGLRSAAKIRLRSPVRETSGRNLLFAHASTARASRVCRYVSIGRLQLLEKLDRNDPSVRVGAQIQEFLPSAAISLMVHGEITFFRDWQQRGANVPSINRITTDKSLVSYRECLGKRRSRGFRCSIRGTFDRGDLKEVRFEFPGYGV